MSRTIRALAPISMGVTAAAILALSSIAQAGDALTPHRPDLQTLAPADLSIENTGNQKLLRFTTSIANLGDGPLELRPWNSPRTRLTIARQRVYTHDVNGLWAPHSETTAGHFLFHPQHNHWHFYDFATYELRNVASGGGIGNNVLATSGKVTFCMVDSAQVNSTLPHSAPAAYGQCTQTNPQGISVGWTDLYPASLPGQSLDITNFAIGQYWLVVTADPSNRLLETNDANNTAALKISIRGNRVTLAP